MNSLIAKSGPKIKAIFGFHLPKKTRIFTKKLEIFQRKNFLFGKIIDLAVKLNFY